MGESHWDKPLCFHQVVLGWKALNMQENSLWSEKWPNGEFVLCLKQLANETHLAWPARHSERAWCE